MASVPTSPIVGDIPAFTPSSALPPFLGSDPAIPAAMSPYKTSLVKLVDRFATTSARKDILKGYLDHRAALLSLGISGFQWLDGSFLEDIESLEGRAPRDIDLVTFVVRPAHLLNDQIAWNAMLNSNRQIFEALQAKATFRTDAYFVDIKFGPQYVIQQTTYWFGLFSHRRITSLWKGILEIPLTATSDDASAIALLSTK
jgi:hypothetical protein